MIPELQEATMIGVYGPVASGKTFLLQQWIKAMERALIFDPTAEWDSTKVEGLEVIQAQPKMVAQRIEQAHERGEPYKLAYYPGDVDTGFKWCAEAIWQPSEPRWFAIEECSLIMSPQYKHPNMNILMRFSRKRLLGVIGASQRIADVHKDFTSNSRMSVLFHTTEPRDVDAIEERFGAEAKDSMLNLRPLDYDDASGAVRAIPQALVHRRGKGFEVMEIG